MRGVLAVFCALWAVVSSAGALNFPVVEAEVFQQGAVLKRALVLSPQLFDERGELVLELLYATEEAPFVFSSEGARVLSSVRQWVDNPNVASLEQEQDALELETEVLRNRLWLVEEAMRKVEGVSGDGELAVLEKRWRMLRAEIQALVTRSKVLSESLERAREQGRYLRLELHLALEGAPQEGVRLEALEHSRALFWQAESVLDLDTAQKRLEMLALARLSYLGAEDLSEVRLRLGIVPSRVLELPTYREARVDFAEDGFYGGGAVAPMMMRAVALDKAELVAHGVDFVVDLQGSYVLRAGEELLLVYGQARFPVALFNAVYQWGEASALLQAEWVNEVPFYLGLAQLKRDGLWLDSVSLPFLSAGERVRLSFGENPALSVRQERAHVYEHAVEDREGFLVRSVQQGLAIEALREDGLAVRVYGRLPVSANERIEVVERFSPDFEALEEERGLFLWQRAPLNKDEVWSLRLDYEVVFPEGERVFIEGL